MIDSKSCDNVQKDNGDSRIRRAYRSLLSLLCFAAVFAGVAFVLLKTSLVEDVVGFAQRSWYWSCLIFGTAIFLTCFPIPGYGTVALIAGYVMGFWRAAILTSVASLIGSSCAFWVGREMLRDWIESQVMTRRKLCIIYNAICAGGFKVVCLIRFAPLPYGLVNMLLCVTSCSFSSFILASFLDCFRVCLDIFIGSQARCLTDIFKNHRHTTLEQKLSVIFSVVCGAAALFGFSAFVAKTLRDADLQRALDPPTGSDSDSDLTEAAAPGDDASEGPAAARRRDRDGGDDVGCSTATGRRCPTTCGCCRMARDVCVGGGVGRSERSHLARDFTGYGTVGGGVSEAKHLTIPCGRGTVDPGGSGRSGSSWIASSFDAASWSISTGARWHLETVKLSFTSRPVPLLPSHHHHHYRSACSSHGKLTTHPSLPEDVEPPPIASLSHRHTTASTTPRPSRYHPGVDVNVQTDRPDVGVSSRADPAPPSLSRAAVTTTPQEQEDASPLSSLRRSRSLPDGRLRRFQG